MTPQILTKGRRADVGRIVGRGPGRDERPSRRRGIRRANESLSDQGTIEPERAPAGDRGGRPDAGFGDDEPVVRDPLAEARCPLDVDVERPKVAVVESDEARPGSDRRIDLARIVGFDERLETDVHRDLDQAGELLRRVEHSEQEDEVGAGRAQDRQLDVLDDEILGEDRHGHRGTHGTQVVDGATEPMRLAQDGDRRGTTGFIGASSGDDVVATGRDPAGRRRFPLDLGDEMEPGAARRPTIGRGGSASKVDLDHRRRPRGRELGADVGPTPFGDLGDDVVAGRGGHPLASGDRGVGGAPFGPQGLEQLAGEPRVDRQRRPLDPLLELADHAGDEQRRPGVEQDDVAPDPGLAAQDRLGQSSVLLGRPAGRASSSRPA